MKTKKRADNRPFHLFSYGYRVRRYVSARSMTEARQIVGGNFGRTVPMRQLSPSTRVEICPAGMSGVVCYATAKSMAEEWAGQQVPEGE